jgi:phage tail sheath gpL-like
VVNQADWCSVCKTHGQRAFGAFMENNKEGAISIVLNDVTNAESKKKSSVELTKVGLNEAMSNYKASGVIYFFDAATKKPITQITVANSNEEIGYVMSEIIKSIK